MNLSARPKKTVLRTIRISEEVDGILEKDAKAHRTGVNSLISSIMGKYAEWDRYTEKFGHVAIPTSLFRALLELIDENALVALADRVSVELTNEITSFWFKKTNLETVLQFFSITCEYGKVGEVEIENEGRNYTITVYHEYGRKWSIWLQHYIDKVIRTFVKAIPQFETTENTLTLKFQVP
jgi:uncharacterized protein YxeA